MEKQSKQETTNKRKHIHNTRQTENQRAGCYPPKFETLSVQSKRERRTKSKEKKKHDFKYLKSTNKKREHKTQKVCLGTGAPDPSLPTKRSKLAGEVLEHLAPCVFQFCFWLICVLFVFLFLFSIF